MNDKTNPHFREGQLAFHAGVSHDDCPAEKGNRTSWFTGWFNARINHRLGDIFNRFGVGPV